MSWSSRIQQSAVFPTLVHTLGANHELLVRSRPESKALSLNSLKLRGERFYVFHAIGYEKDVVYSACDWS